MLELSQLTTDGLTFLVSVICISLGATALLTATLFLLDISQSHDAVRRNYPVLGRFRYLFSALGEFFRQYFFALDREEMPFNRAEREWVYRSAAGKDNSVAFGSTRTLTPVGTPIFESSPFPTLDEESTASPSLLIGPHCHQPYLARSIVNISGMSYGALSKPAVQALSRGAAMAGCWLNTGEGGVSPFHLEGGCDIVFQIGTAKYGVRTEKGQLSNEKLCDIAAIPQVKMFEIKLSQGAKPGKGGILPADKVNGEIAKIRGIPIGKASLSPNRHPEHKTIGDILDMIDLVRRVTGKPVGIKTVVWAWGWLQELCDEIHRRGPESAPDFITVDGGDGGTGAAPMQLMDNVGVPLREGLPIVADILDENGLRPRVCLIASGKLITPAEVAWAFCAGANFTVSARGFMFALGCIQAMKCNKNTCPTGITTHNRRLQRGLNPEHKSVRVKNFVEKLRHGVGVIAHSCGVPHPSALERSHVRIVQQDGRSIPLNELYPNRSPQPKLIAAE